MLFFCVLLVATSHACETHYIHGTKPSDGFITSPDFPLPYPSDQNCLFNISTIPGFVINLYFTEFHLENPVEKTGQCLHDYVLVTVIDRQGREHIGERLCGSTLPTPFKTMQSMLYVFFHSSHTNQFSGFQIRYEFISEETIPEPTSSYFDHDMRYQKYCGGKSKEGALDGEIISPGFPGTFPKNVSCNWLIRARANKKIYLRLRYLELSPTMAECDRASLYIIDGYRHESNDLRKEDGSQIRFCGGQLYYNEEGMKSYMSNANRLIVRFVTTDYPTSSQLEKYNDEGTPIGFRLLWTEIEEVLHEGQACSDFTCKGGEFCIDDGQNICASRSQFCISNGLVCNGISNCAENDYSDEQYCYFQHIIFSMCSIFLVLIIAVALTLVCQKIKRNRRIRKKTRERITDSITRKNGKDTIWEYIPNESQSNAIRFQPSSFREQLIRPELADFRPALV